MGQSQEVDDLKKQVDDLQARLADIEENFNRIHPWLVTIYNDMLNLHIASLAMQRGETDKAMKLKDQLVENYKALTLKGEIDG